MAQFLQNLALVSFGVPQDEQYLTCPGVGVVTPGLIIVVRGAFLLRNDTLFTQLTMPKIARTT
ncbi:MAG: hypothetical protein RBG13Loki_2613, partial [Promethearchaeota archaeon CR_4]